MEARVARLEANVERMVADVNSMNGSLANARERLAGLEVKVDHLPSKGFIVTALLVMLAVITALVGYADTIKKILPGAVTSPQKSGTQ
jgi:hypothetical protein